MSIIYQVFHKYFPNILLLKLSVTEMLKELYIKHRYIYMYLANV